MINPRFGSYYQGSLPSSTGGGNPFGNLIMAGLGMGYDAYQQNQQRKANIKQENKARAWNKKMWDEINRYNHPIQQMARLAEAGLNPNLIYGSSPGSAVGNAGQIHPGKAPEQKYSNIVSPAISQFQNLKVQQAQSNNLNTSAMKNVAAANLSSSQETKLKNLLAGDIRLQEEQINKAQEDAAQAKLMTNAMSNKDNGIAVRYATEVKNLLLDNEIKQASVEVEKLNAFLAKNNIRPGDPLWYRFMGYAFNKGVQLSKDIREEIINQFNEILDKFK